MRNFANSATYIDRTVGQTVGGGCGGSRGRRQRAAAAPAAAGHLSRQRLWLTGLGWCLITSLCHTGTSRLHDICYIRQQPQTWAFSLQLSWHRRGVNNCTQKIMLSNFNSNRITAVVLSCYSWGTGLALASGLVGRPHCRLFRLRGLM